MNTEKMRPASPDQTVVLVAEDDVVVREIVRITLEREGYYILAAGDGEQALHMSRQYNSTIHALVSDVNMPKMNGLDLRKQVLLERPAIKVLLMSGQVDAPVENVPLIRKPFAPKILKELLSNLLQA